MFIPTLLDELFVSARALTTVGARRKPFTLRTR